MGSKKCFLSFLALLVSTNAFAAFQTDRLDLRNGTTSSGTLRTYEDADSGTNYIQFMTAPLGSNLQLVWNITTATCSGDGNGGALTIDGSNNIVCSADDGGAGGSGDVTSVGDCASGACYDGTSAGGTYARLYDGDSNYGAFVTANLTGNRTYTFGNLSLTFDQSVAAASAPAFTSAALTTPTLIGASVIGGATGVSMSAATGVLTLTGIGNTNNENLVVSFESAANVINLSSGTGANVISTTGLGMKFGDDSYLQFGDFSATSNDAKIDWNTTGNDNLQLGLRVGGATDSGYLTIVEHADAVNANRSPLATSADPVIRVYSADEAVATDYIDILNNQTDSIVRSGTGTLILGGHGQTNNEQWKLDFESVANTVTTSSGTGVTDFDFGTLDVNTDTLDLTGTGTINGIDAIDATSETTLEATLDIGGEVTSTGMSTTVIADSITVTGWVMGASTATTPSADDNDTSLATTAYVQTELNAAGGRSISCASGSCDADVELYTRTLCYRLGASPVATDDDKSIWINDSANQFTITRLWAESDQTVTMMIQVDDGSPSDVDTADLAPAAGVASDTSLNGDTTVAAGDRIDLDVASVANTPTWAVICWTGTYDD